MAAANYYEEDWVAGFVPVGPGEVIDHFNAVYQECRGCPTLIPVTSEAREPKAPGHIRGEAGHFCIECSDQIRDAIHANETETP